MLHWWECSSKFGFPEFPQKFEEYREYCVVNGYGHFENLKKKNRPPFILKNPITSRLTGTPGTSRQQFLTTVYSVVSSAAVFGDVMQCSPQVTSQKEAAEETMYSVVACVYEEYYM